MSYQGVLFDLDGTLVDSVEDMYMALNLTLTEVAYPIVSYAQVKTWVGNGIATLVERALSGDTEINPDLSQSLVDHSIVRFKLHYHDIVGDYAALYAHVETGLSALAHLPKALVTNKDRAFTELLLNKLKLSHYFDVLICGDDTEKKPSPKPLIMACKSLDLNVDDVMMVGDSKSDILAAKNAKVDVIAVKYGYNQGYNLEDFNPEYLCEGFLDIIPILNKRN
ncbi:phosphoglycolate phosphatase [Pseudoalteromonas citrea]|uniref:phosphoglycolate phosphatase n=2 Tax=Pseudoalteromonas citrea TaxID=43655 RepID=A0AAD4AH48_9GAMM|nr:HAD-IA family hydrolase [Pseudoalteromonas citrea]KAF7769000.1 phosphoglycolate phosphatase [Pseudoalteromonas citrea]